MDLIFLQVCEELNSATDKFPMWPVDPIHAMAVLGEEFGELNKEVLKLCYEPGKSSLEAVEAEAIQTAAMAIRFLLGLDHYRFNPVALVDVCEPIKIGCASCDRGDNQLGHHHECSNKNNRCSV